MSVIVNQRKKALEYIQDVPPTNSSKIPETYYSNTNKDLYHKNTNSDDLGFDNGFNVVTWTGNETYGKTVTGVGFQPDIVWGKARSLAYSHRLADSNRGSSYVYYTDNPFSSYNSGEYLSFDSDGFTLNGGVGLNANLQSFVAWCWRCPNDASHASHNGEKYNSDTGVSIIRYTGNGSSKAITHSLGKKPVFGIVKCEANTNNFAVFHKSLSSYSYYLLLNTTSTENSDSTVWNAEPTSTTVTVGSSGTVNSAGVAYTMYLFTDIDNYSSMGSYVGNSSANGPRIRCGFKPALLLVKGINYGANWAMIDNARDTSNPRDTALFANLTDVDATGYDVDFLEDGFQIRTSADNLNQNTYKYLYIAFADTTYTVDRFKRVLGGYGPGDSYGFTMGGLIGSTWYSKIDRFIFPLDSGNASTVGNLQTTMSYANACNCSTYGYNIAGWDSNSQYSSIISRITFPFNSGTSNNVANIASSIRLGSGFNSSVHGFYICGYNSVGDLSSVHRFIFPFDSGTANTTGNIGYSIQTACGLNSSLSGYIGGGMVSSAGRSRVIGRILYPFNSGVGENVGNLNTSKSSPGGFNSSTHGYICGGHWNFAMSTIDRITFPFDSGSSSVVGNLSVSRQDFQGCNSSFHGYSTAGYSDPGYPSSIDRITFPFNSGTASNVGNLSGTIQGHSAIDGVDFVSQFIQNALNI